jgi:hypothetical protein
VANVSIIGIALTPKGVLGDKPWPSAADTATRARDLAIAYGNCFRGLATAHSHLRGLGLRRWPSNGAGARERGAPESPVFAEQKMRPNYAL